MKKSLFIVSLPRSLSSLAYHVSRLALDLDQPAWTADGEILNTDRYGIYGGPTEDAGRKYTCPDREPAHALAARALLDDLVHPHGRIYKDVVQPFVISAWLAPRSHAILRIRRPLADVAHAMLGREWLYPTRVSADPHLPRALLDGLLKAERALAALPAQVVEFDDLITDEQVIAGALARLYPEAPLHRVHYINDDFRAQREAILARRESPSYRDLEALTRDLVAGTASRIESTTLTPALQS